MSEPGDMPGRGGEPEVPEPLARELRAVYRGSAAAGGMDDAMLRLARERAAVAGRARRWRATGWASVAAAAAVVGIVVFVETGPRTGPAGPRVGHGVALAHDVNVDGVVDILDALVLARAIEPGSGVARDQRWDVNGDGAVDGVDVQAVAASAVRLEGRG